jgi:hypothetical protein
MCLLAAIGQWRPLPHTASVAKGTLRTAASKTMGTPLLSIVYSVRDPDYGGGLLHRMQTSMSTLAELGRVCKLDYELIVVEWNPPSCKKPLRELVSWPAYARGRLRFVEVPPSVHETIGCSEAMPFLEYIAKNVGIKRAKGDWILSTTPDCLFNKELVRFLARGRLESNSFYRVDRHDVGADITLDHSWRRRLQTCSENVIRVNRLGETVERVPDLQRSRVTGSIGVLRRAIEAWFSPDNSPAVGEERLHTNAAGDFLLMSRENWLRLRGFTELTTHAHIDSIMCWTAKSAGLKQAILREPIRLYHQEHDRSLHDSFPVTDWTIWHQRFLDCVERGMPLISNDEDWGLGETRLTEYEF